MACLSHMGFYLFDASLLVFYLTSLYFEEFIFGGFSVAFSLLSFIGFFFLLLTSFRFQEITKKQKGRITFNLIFFLKEHKGKRKQLSRKKKKKKKKKKKGKKGDFRRQRLAIACLVCLCLVQKRRNLPFGSSQHQKHS